MNKFLKLTLLSTVMMPSVMASLQIQPHAQGLHNQKNFKRNPVVQIGALANQNKLLSNQIAKLEEQNMVLQQLNKDLTAQVDVLGTKMTKAELAEVCKMIRIDFSSNSMEEIVKRLNNIEFLDLSFNNIGLEEAKALAAAINSGKLTRLQSLYLGYNKIDFKGAKALVAAINSGNLPQLQIFDLKNNEIGAEGTKALVSAINSDNLPQLQSLNLESNRINSKGVKVLIEAINSGNLSQLQNLYLGYNNIDFEDAKALAVAIKNGCLINLQKLDLSGNSIDSMKKENLESSMAAAKTEKLLPGNFELKI